MGRIPSRGGFSLLYLCKTVGAPVFFRIGTTFAASGRLMSGWRGDTLQVGGFLMARVGIAGIRPTSATLELVVGRYGDRVYKLACQLTRSATDAEDIVQDVFLKLYTHWLQASASSSLEAWLSRVTTNASIDFLRSRRRRGRNLGDGALALLPGPGDPPGRSMECRETARKLEACLADLPPRQLAALVLFEQQGLKGKEIARILGVNAVTARSYVCDARHRIKDALAPYLKGRES